MAAVAIGNGERFGRLGAEVDGQSASLLGGACSALIRGPQGGSSFRPKLSRLAQILAVATPHIGTGLTSTPSLPTFVHQSKYQLPTINRGTYLGSLPTGTYFLYFVRKGQY